MYRFTLLLMAVLVSCNNSNSQDQSAEDQENNNVTTFYFIRHAEKELDSSTDPELTVQGKERASAWVNYFFLKEVDHVLSSDFQRTKATAQPLAQAQNLEVEIYDVRATTGKELLEKYRGKTVVLFGHSNTINRYANDLQDDTQYPELDEADYDHFFVVQIDDQGNSSARLEESDFVD